MPKRALICDDDRLFRLWLTRLLRAWGGNVETEDVASAVSDERFWPLICLSRASEDAGNTRSQDVRRYTN